MELRVLHYFFDHCPGRQLNRSSQSPEPDPADALPANEGTRRRTRTKNCFIRSAQGMLLTSEGLILRKRAEEIMELGGKSYWSTTFHTYGLYVGRDETIYYFDGIEVLRHPTNDISKENRFSS